MIPLVQVAPGSISRGAIQQLIPADSRWAQIASAVSRSLLEWLMKTIDGMLPPRYDDFNRFAADSLHKIAAQNAVRKRWPNLNRFGFRSPGASRKPRRARYLPGTA